MSKQEIKKLIESKVDEDGMVGIGIKGVSLFRVSNSVRCAPAVYEPCIVAIVSGSKEAILDAQHYIYDEQQYLCCSMTMPVEAGTPNASPDNPLLGVMVSLDTKVMTELAIEMASGAGSSQKLRTQMPKHRSISQGLTLSSWDEGFTDALYRLLQLAESSADSSVLGDGRLRELYYAIMKGGAGESARRAFGVGNEIARSIEYLSSRLDEGVTIEDMALQVGMSRAALHRKFKEATSMSPIQFVKAMRLNTAAMKIAGGVNVNVAAQEVGYVSSSQFSREFKRMYGQSPKEWRNIKSH
ncbi:AraC family transcriptional regulator [Marinomonas sp. C2222]|uniref:AraC family transcriptional regulator n=1 Tax=Marinomonas sargassi TaxID=2984494 RepID=A0ABT2YQQ8_9GAMM|nr:AraC family transcriptional regulator [Marinomonas sargassi]MCV2402233.1 AraC family transcriptional regulator [Marinomonas sargassi]